MIDKLVRDLVPDILRAEGQLPVTEVVTGDDYARYLWEKLNEEVDELYTPSDVDTLAGAMLDEIVDVMEVLYALAAHYGWDAATVDDARATKRTERGGFTHGIVWKGNL